MLAPPAPVVSACGRLAPAAAVFVFLAPIPTMQQIRQDRAVGSLPLLPYSSMIASTFIWVTYGIMKREPSIWSCNSVGLVLGTLYFLNFVKFAPKAAPTFPGSISQHFQGIMAVIASTLLLAKSPLQSPVSLIGTAGVLFCIAMFASPLAALKTVVATRSAKSIPLPFTMASLINCGLWSIVGIWGMRDMNIIVPNLLGLTFSLIQVALKLFYGSGPPLKTADLPL